MAHEPAIMLLDFGALTQLPLLFYVVVVFDLICDTKAILNFLPNRSIDDEQL